jgi:hypothetical protein
MWELFTVGTLYFLLRNWGGLALLIVVAIAAPWGIGKVARAPRIVLAAVVLMYLLLACAGGVIAWLQW